MSSRLSHRLIFVLRHPLLTIHNYAIMFCNDFPHMFIRAGKRIGRLFETEAARDRREAWEEWAARHYREQSQRG